MCESVCVCVCRQCTGKDVMMSEVDEQEEAKRWLDE